MTDKATDGKYCPDCYQVVRPGEIHSKKGCGPGGEMCNAMAGTLDGLSIFCEERKPCSRHDKTPARGGLRDAVKLARDAIDKELGMDGLQAKDRPGTRARIADIRDSLADALEAALAVPEGEDGVAKQPWGKHCGNCGIAWGVHNYKCGDPTIGSSPDPAPVRAQAGDALTKRIISTLEDLAPSSECVKGVMGLDPCENTGMPPCKFCEARRIVLELKDRAPPPGPSVHQVILEEIEQRLGIERDAEAEKAEGRWSKLGKGMDRLIEDRSCPHGMRLWKNCIECTPDPSPAGPARRTWPVLECEACDGAGHRGESTVDTSSGPSGRKIACETCGGNEDSLGCGWIEIVTVAPSNDTEYICAACRETCDATVRHACTAPTAGAGLIISVSDFRRAFQDIIDRTLATGRYPARVRTEMRTMIEAIPAAGDSEPAIASPAVQALKLESAQFLGEPCWMTPAPECPKHAGQKLEMEWQRDGRLMWLCSVCKGDHRHEQKRAAMEAEKDAPDGGATYG